MIPKHALDSLSREMKEAQERFGPFATSHELYAVLLEEMDEFWDSVKADRPDAYELLQVAAVALRGYLQLTEGAKHAV